MSNYLLELVDLVPPPACPVHAKGSWSGIEHALGLTLPDDYKQFIGLYGSGILCSLFEIRSPFSLEDHYKQPVEVSWRSWAGIYNCWGDEPRIASPYPIYPVVPGLLPWGTYGDVDVLGWLTDHDPDKWIVVYLDDNDGYLTLEDCSFTRFIVSAIRGESSLPERVLGKHILTKPKIYEPF